MAIDTRAEHLEMIHGIGRCPHAREVAVLTNIRGRDVGEIFSGRFRAIVATVAVADDIAVIEGRRKPRGRAVTRIALVAAERMIRRLSLALNVIVAGRATAEDGVVIHLRQRDPDSRAMAVLTGISTDHMIGGFGAGANTSRQGVAGFAIEWRTLEYAPHMAALAVHIEVRAIQSKSGGEVVEIRCKARLRPAR